MNWILQSKICHEMLRLSVMTRHSSAIWNLRFKSQCKRIFWQQSLLNINMASTTTFITYVIVFVLTYLFCLVFYFNQFRPPVTNLRVVVGYAVFFEKWNSQIIPPSCRIAWSTKENCNVYATRSQSNWKWLKTYK